MVLNLQGGDAVATLVSALVAPIPSSQLLQFALF